jgi:hypothetical protein
MGFIHPLNLLISGFDTRLEQTLSNLVLLSNTRYGSLRMLKLCAESLSINTGAGLALVNQASQGPTTFTGKLLLESTIVPSWRLLTNSQRTQIASFGATREMVPGQDFSKL